MSVRFISNLKSTFSLKGLILIFLWIGIFHPESFSQDLSRKISITATDIPMEQVIQDISQKADIYFSYSPQIIPAKKLLTINYTDKSVKYILRKILKKNNLKYDIVENQVVLKPRRIYCVDTIEAAHKLLNYTVSGYIKDQSTGELLIGAHIYEAGTFNGTATNSYGFYSLSLKEGKHKLQYSFVGYENFDLDMHLDKDVDMNIDLLETQLNMKEVRIVADEYDPGFLEKQISEFRYNQQTLEKLPGFAGDLDVIKSLQLIPGIESFGDGSALFYVRGGNSDQNLILVDEAPVYNPSHMFGFFSVISPDAISDVEVYKGDFPVKYGGRLSSVVDIKTKNGNVNKFGFGGNIGPYASSLSFEGPIIKEKISFYLTGRLSTLQWLPNLTDDAKDIEMSFYDINAKANYQLNANNRLYLTFYTGNDLLKRNTSSAIQTFGIGWNNILGSIRWNHIFNQKLFSNTTAYYSRYKYFLYLSDNHNDHWNSSISHLAVKSDFTWFINQGNTFSTGFKASTHHSNPGNVFLSDPEEDNEVPEVSEYNSVEYVLYLGNEQKMGDRFTFRYGLHIPAWLNYGPSTIYFFNDDHKLIDTFSADKNARYSSFIDLEPRINVEYLVGKNASVKAGYSRTTQYLHELTNSVSPFTSLAVWVPSGPNIEPQKTDQYTVGYFMNLRKSMFRLSVEGFYKHFYSYIDYAPHANMLYNPLIEGELRIGEAWSYGGELMLRKLNGNLTGWLGYTYSRVFVKTPGINNEEVYPAFHDRPHNISIFLSYDTRKRWAVSANWIYMTGAAITTPTGFYNYNGYVVPIYGEKNNQRLPDYHRLDLSVSFRLNKVGSPYKHELLLTLYNAYGRLNPYSISFNKIKDAEDKYVIPSDQYIYNDLVPTSISVSGIIPSLNYKFRF